MRRQTRAYTRAAAAVLLWSTVATAFELTLRHIDFVGLVLWSSLVSTGVLFLVLVAQGKIGHLGRMTARDWGMSAVMGMLNPFAYYLVLFKAYSMLPAQQAQPLNYTWPVVLVLASIPVLGQKIRLQSILACLVSFAGVVVVSTQGRLSTLRVESPLGVGLAVASSLVWATYWLVGMRDRRDDVVKLFCGFVFGCAAIMGTSVATGSLAIPPWQALAGAAYVGLFEMGVTFVLWLGALELSRTTAQVSILVYLSPFLSLVLIGAVLKEKILPATVVGLVLIVAGVAIGRLGELMENSRSRRAA